LRTTLGRAADNSICLDDKAVSAHHAVIQEMPNGGYLLEDLGTTNGTLVGGALVQNRELCEGDKISLGRVEFSFTMTMADGTPIPSLPSALDPTASRTPALPEVTSSSTISRGTLRHSVQMTISEEIAAVKPTWEMSAQANQTLVDMSPTTVSLQDDYDQLLAGYQIIHAIVGEDDLDVILNTIVNSVIDLMKVDRAAVLLVSSEGKLIPHVALQNTASYEEFKVSTSILNYVVEHRAAVVCNDLGMDDRFSNSRSIIMNKVRSAMSVPILHDGELVGVLHMDSQITNKTFDHKSLEVVTTIANTVASAVRTALLKDQIHEIQRQQAEAMRAMISGASHFINNPLAVIRANLGMFEEWSGTLTKFHVAVASDPSSFDALRQSHGIDYIDEELLPMSKETSKSADRIGEIVRALHVFEHQNNSDSWVEFDVSEVVQEVFAEQEAAVAAVAQPHLQLVPAIMSGARDRIKLLLSNVVNNAWQAIEEGSPEKNWVIASCYENGGRVLIAIDDTGRGIAVDRRHCVFAPFETDRLDGSLGLGLAVAAEVARQHGARLEVRDRDGGGTRVLIDLPLVG